MLDRRIPGAGAERWVESAVVEDILREEILGVRLYDERDEELGRVVRGSVSEGDGT